MKKIIITMALLILLIIGWMLSSDKINFSFIPTIESPSNNTPPPQATNRSPIEPLRPPIPPPLPTFFEKLSDAAIERTMHSVVYDPKYVKIAYPMGDVPANTGVCTDVVIRAYRQLGIDLQQRVHEDMQKHFNAYPAKKIWGSKQPDSNIDHRRVYNLQAFFKRFAETLPITDVAKDYQPGDLVTWQITPKFPHIGIMVDVATDDPDRHMVVHNIADGPQIDDILFAFPITGHYRYRDAKK